MGTSWKARYLCSLILALFSLINAWDRSDLATVCSSTSVGDEKGTSAGLAENLERTESISLSSMVFRGCSVLASTPLSSAFFNATVY